MKEEPSNRMSEEEFIVRGGVMLYLLEDALQSKKSVLEEILKPEEQVLGFENLLPGS